MNAVFRHRDWLACGYAVTAMLVLAFAPVPRLQAPKLPQEQMIQLTLETLPEPEPVKPVEPVPPKIIPPVQPVVPPTVPPKPQRVRQPALAASATKQVEAPQAVPVTQPSEVQPAQQQVQPVQPAPPTAPGPAAKTPEEIYIAGLRLYLESIKRYPTSREARLERPSGESAIWFILNRDGGLVDTGIEHGSGSMLLDQAALSTVRRGEYRPFPPDAWGGKAEHRFTARLNFTLDHN